MGALLWIALAVPFAAGLAALVVRRAAWLRLSGILVSGAALACGLALVAATRNGGVPEAAGGLLRADALSAYMLALIGAVALVATWGGAGDRHADPGRGGYAPLVCLFVGAMSLAVLADNLGVMWVAVEATTIATAFLVGHHRTRLSLEAAWKYVILGSVGVAIAFLGIVLLYGATRAAGAATLSWATLSSDPPPLDPDNVRLAAALAVLGFATKAGLAPMHSWLPDAHGQAPAPVSGLMSGVLLAVAFYAVLRMQAIADTAVGTGLMRAMLATGALLSLAVAGLLLLRQRDYKRMLAYSSIEHMGLMALGAAAGGRLAMASVLLHMLGHGLSKAALFVLSGRILATEHTTVIAEARGLMRRRPGVAVPFLVAMAALLGFPPFSLFFSEVGIILGAWTAGMAWVAAAALVLLLVVFAGLTRHTLTLALGGEAPRAPAPADWSPRGPWAPVALALGVTAVAGFLATPVGGALTRAVAALGAGS